MIDLHQPPDPSRKPILGAQTGQQSPIVACGGLGGYLSSWFGWGGLGGLPMNPGSGAGFGMGGGSGVGGFSGSGDVYGSPFQLPGSPALWPGTYWFYRLMLRDPTVQVARATALYPVLAGGWVVESDDDAPEGSHEAVEKYFMPRRLRYLRDATRAVDYGWSPLETVWEIQDGLMVPTRFKPLLHEYTRIDVDGHGDFLGFENATCSLPLTNCLLYTYDEESGNLYGRGRLENLRRCEVDWNDANNSACRYDHKIAGVFIVVHYPPGMSINKEGQKVPNFVIAQKILDNIQAGHGIAVPNEFAAIGDELDGELSRMGVELKDRRRWNIELLEDKGSRQPQMITRLEYIDKLKFRGYLVPERAASEASKGGSRADSENHADIVTLGAELVHQELVGALNEGPVATFMRFNYGPESVDKVRMRNLPVIDEKREFIQDVVKGILAGDKSMALEILNLPQTMAASGLDLDEDADARMEALRERSQQRAQQADDGMAVARADDKNPVTKALLSRLQAIGKERIRFSREESSGGHWVTIGGEHVFLNSEGTITKGPAALVGQNHDAKAHPIAQDHGANHPETGTPDGPSIHHSQIKAGDEVTREYDPSGRGASPVITRGIVKRRVGAGLEVEVKNRKEDQWLQGETHTEKFKTEHLKTAHREGKNYAVSHELKPSLPPERPGQKRPSPEQFSTKEEYEKAVNSEHAAQIEHVAKHYEGIVNANGEGYEYSPAYRTKKEHVAAAKSNVQHYQSLPKTADQAGIDAAWELRKADGPGEQSIQDHPQFDESHVVDGVYPTGYGLVGPQYSQFSGRGHKAIGHLKKVQAGEVPAAISNAHAGDIDLLWGNEKHGLAKIVKKHPEVAEKLPEVIAGMGVLRNDPNHDSIELSDGTYTAVVKKVYGPERTSKRWLLTAFDDVARRNKKAGS